MKNNWSEEAMEHILELLKTETLSITFTKLDGTERVMKCTLAPSVLEEFFSNTEHKDEPRAEFDSGFNVFDLEKKQWRRIRWDSIIKIQGAFPILLVKIKELNNDD